MPACSSGAGIQLRVEIALLQIRMLILDMFLPQVLVLFYPDIQPWFHDSIKMYDCRPIYVLSPHTRIVPQAENMPALV